MPPISDRRRKHVRTLHVLSTWRPSDGASASPGARARSPHRWRGRRPCPGSPAVAGAPAALPRANWHAYWTPAHTYVIVTRDGRDRWSSQQRMGSLPGSEGRDSAEQDHPQRIERRTVSQWYRRFAHRILDRRRKPRERHLHPIPRSRSRHSICLGGEQVILGCLGGFASQFCLDMLEDVHYGTRRAEPA
jgi:hypothetical protein